MRARPTNAPLGGGGFSSSKPNPPTSGEHAVRFHELAQREADAMADTMRSLNLGGQQRDVVAEKQQSTVNGGLETSTFTVAARVRPLSEQEMRQDNDNAFACVTPSGPGKGGRTETAAVLTPKINLRGVPTLEKQTFAFDKFFGADSGDDDLYVSLGAPLVKRAMAGQVGVVFAYGQTGSGKTHTMGGLLRRVAGDLFSGSNSGSEKKKRAINFSYFEVLGNNCQDCLVVATNGKKTQWGGTQSAAAGGAGPQPGAVQIGEGMDGGVITRNLSSHAAPDARTLLRLIDVAQSRRSTAATEKNATSSRSHGVGIITIGAEQFDSDSEQDPYGPRPGVLYVIDLAGSERSADSAKHSKERMDETKAVNLSLMSLKECIRARTAAAKPADPNNPNARPHVPYRRSKLTLLMKDVFDIECRRMCSTVVVACVSPSARDAAHSVNTLTYAAPLRVAIAATKDAAPLPVDPKDPVQWSHDRACDWLEEQIVHGNEKYASGVDVERILHPGSNGRELCSLPEPEFHKRLRAQIPGQMGAHLGKKTYDALWALIVDAKTRRRRPDGTVLTDEDEAREVRQAEEALAARSALWAERDKAMARGGF